MITLAYIYFWDFLTSGIDELHSQWTVGMMSLCLGAVDASADLKSADQFFSQWMHLPTQKLESVDASADPNFIFLIWWMYPPTQKLELANASTDQKVRVGGCIHRPKNYSQWMHPPILLENFIRSQCGFYRVLRNYIGKDEYCGGVANIFRFPKSKISKFLVYQS